MDKGIQESEEINEGNRCFSGESNQRTCSPQKAGRKPKEDEPGINNIWRFTFCSTSLHTTVYYLAF